MEIKLENVSYSNGKDILKDITYTFDENKITGITGKSGSGKTTLVELINVLIKPTKGKIEIGSKIITNKRKIDNINNLRYKIGLIFENPEEQFFCETVKEEIEFGMKYFHKTVKSIDKHINEALFMVGLDNSYLDKNPFNLSSGEMRKVAIASVLAFNPKIIIFDNPTLGLDNKSIESLIRLIKLLKNRHKKTILIVSKDTDFLLKVVDNVLLLNNGSVALKGNKYDVLKSNIENYGLKTPNIILFKKLAKEKKNINLLNRDDINDLMKDVYRNV